MSEIKGLTGWLDPEGIFHPCDYGEHSIFAQEVIDDYPYSAYDRLRYEKFFIPMGSLWDESRSYVFINIDEKIIEPIITEEQRKWFVENFNKLDLGQKEMVSDWLDFDGK
jgi:hypothetical protein